MLRRILLAVVLLVLVALAWLGLSGGVHDLPQSTTVGEKVQSLTQLLYGAFALLTAVTTFWGRRWARVIRASWIVICAVAGGLASIAWGGTTLAKGLLSGIASAAIAATIVWLLRVGALAVQRAPTQG